MRSAKLIPKDELVSITDNIGIPYSGLNLSYSNSAPIGPGDADILVDLKKDHRPTAKYVHDLRFVLADKFPGVTFYFLPADIVGQILNFGLPAPIDVQVIGRNIDANRAFADDLYNKLKFVPGVADLRIHQVFNQPKLHFDVDRTKADQVGFSQRDIAQNLLISLKRQLPDRADFLARSENGRQLQHRHAITAVRHRHAAEARQHPDHQWQRQQRRGAADFFKPHVTHARSGIRGFVALQRPAGDRHFRKRGRPRPGRGGARHSADHRRCEEKYAPRHADRRSRANPHDEVLLLGPAVGVAVFDRARVHADRRQLSVVARSVRDFDGPCLRRSPASCGCFSSRAPP